MSDARALTHFVLQTIEQHIYELFFKKKSIRNSQYYIELNVNLHLLKILGIESSETMTITFFWSKSTYELLPVKFKKLIHAMLMGKNTQKEREKKLQNGGVSLGSTEKKCQTI